MIAVAMAYAIAKITVKNIVAVKAFAIVILNVVNIANVTTTAIATAIFSS